MTGQPDKFSKLLEVISSQIEKDFADDESDGSIDWKAVSKSMGAANWSPKQCESLWLAHAYATAHDANAESLSSKQRKRSREDGQSDCVACKKDEFNDKITFRTVMASGHDHAGTLLGGAARPPPLLPPMSEMWGRVT